MSIFVDLSVSKTNYFEKRQKDVCLDCCSIVLIDGLFFAQMSPERALNTSSPLITIHLVGMAKAASKAMQCLYLGGYTGGG